jgi:hypothetical protein
VAGRYRKLESEESCDLHSSRSVVTAVKSKRMRWRGMCYVWGRSGIYTEFWLENLKDCDRMEGLGVD